MNQPRGVCTFGVMCLGLLAAWSSLAAADETLVPEGVKVWDVSRQGGRVDPQVGVLADVVLADPAAVPIEPPHDYGAKNERMMDGVPLTERPYVVPGLRPFRFRHFINEFSYGGWHTWNMSDYAAAHGFKYIFNYNNRPPISALPHLPEGAEYLTWGGFNWQEWMKKNGMDPARYDLLADHRLSAEDLGPNVFTRPAGVDRLLMIDIEHSPLMPDRLREQPWYPRIGSAQARAAFEKKYYAGYARSYVRPIELARQAGWAQVGLYGWDPGGRNYYGWEAPEKVQAANQERWRLFGQAIYAHVDIVYNSVYCFYWTADNPAYVLTNIDENRRLIQRATPVKPMRPYYWWLLHGGGTGWRWWQSQPLPDEQVEAITVLGFFSGQQGMVLWSWAGTGNDQQPPPLVGQPTPADPAPKVDVQVGQPFTASGRRPDGSAVSHEFKRYDHLHVLGVTDGKARFQLIGDNLGKDYGVNPQQPVYEMKADDLRARLRPRAEPLRAMFRALALVHRFEPFLAKGELRIDVPAARQFTGRLPIVRRVRQGDLHLVATCDPHAPAQGPGREIVLKDFDGVRGLEVTLPTRQRVQLFVLRTAR